MSTASISVAKKDAEVFPEAKANDILFYVKAGFTQNIHLGHANTDGAMISIYKPVVSIRALEVLNDAVIDADLSVEGMTTTKNLLCRGTILMDSNLVPTNSNIAIGLPNVPFGNAYFQKVTLSNMDLGATINSIQSALSNLTTQVTALRALIGG